MNDEPNASPDGVTPPDSGTAVSGERRRINCGCEFKFIACPCVLSGHSRHALLVSPCEHHRSDVGKEWI